MVLGSAGAVIVRSRIEFRAGEEYKVRIGQNVYYHYPCDRVYEDGKVEHGIMVRRKWAENGMLMVEHWFQGLTH
jgi:hypothetical protein